MDLKKVFTGKNILFATLIIGTIAILVKLSSITLMLFIAFVLACSLMEPVDRLSKYMPRQVATVLALISTIVIGIGFLVPIVSITITELKILIDNLPQKLLELNQFMTTHKIAGKKLIELIDLTSIDKSQELGSTIAGYSIDFTTGVFGGIAIFLVLCIIIYYFVAEKELLSKNFVALFPHKYKKKAVELKENISNKVGGYVTAQILSAAVVGIVVTAGLLLLKVEYALVLGFIAAILDLVPVVGPTLAAIIAIIVTSNGGLLHVLLVIGVILLAQAIQNYWARPVIFSKYLDMHPLAVILSFLIASKFLGIWGVIFAPAIAALFLTLFDELYVKPINNGKND